MTGAKKTVLWTMLLAVGVMLIGTGVFVGVTRLDDADKWGSVIGGLVALIALPMTGYGIVLARHQSGTNGQSVAGSVVGGGVAQVSGVDGNVRIGAAAVPALLPPDPPTAQFGPSSSPAPGSASPASPRGQSVAGSWIAGPVRQIDHVGGDADIDS